LPPVSLLPIRRVYAVDVASFDVFPADFVAEDILGSPIPGDQRREPWKDALIAS
jgi:hypothetical protein